MAQPNEAQNDVYRVLPDSDLAEKRNSRHGVRDVESSDGAGEKLLKKEEVRIVSADMADAKYKAGGQTNGEAKIEIDSNKRTFSGLTKEELLKYQSDPFWVRLRWTMFVLFWALWLCMLVGAVAIIVHSPKCTASSEWYKKTALLDMTDVMGYEAAEERLALIHDAGVRGVVVPASLAGELYGETNLTAFSKFAEAAKQNAVKVIVEMVGNYIPTSHSWFNKSENSEANFTDVLTWAPAQPGNQYPNNWLSMSNEPAWGWSEKRNAFYLRQHGSGADLNFEDERAVSLLADVMRRWVGAGAAGIRLKDAATLLVDRSLRDDTPGEPSDASHAEYRFYSHRPTSNRAQLARLLTTLAEAMQEVDKDSLLTVSGNVATSEPYVRAERALLPLLPISVRPEDSARHLARSLSLIMPYWPAVEVSGSNEAARQLVKFTVLLSVTPVLTWKQLFTEHNNTWKVEPSMAQVMSIRTNSHLDGDVSNVVTHANDTLLVSSTRWSGVKYLSMFNPSSDWIAANITQEPLTAMLTLNDTVLQNDELKVPPRTTVVLKFPDEMNK